MRNLPIALLALAMLAPLAACGRVGPPRPPGPPEAITYPRVYPAPEPPQQPANQVPPARPR
ncbi:MAG: hypothetical protein QJR07_01155 [Acetobacteraceae bacterium]|nr:hypothetical protein [Acetobacteraceae bacterium]